LVEEYQLARPQNATGTDVVVEAMVPHFNGRLSWVMIGNEIDPYFEKHGDERARMPPSSVQQRRNSTFFCRQCK